MPLTRADLKERVLAKLGSPVIDIETDDTQLDIAIDDALDDIRPYMAEVLFAQVPIPEGADRVDLSDLGVEEVVGVYRAPRGGIESDLGLTSYQLKNYTLYGASDNFNVRNVASIHYLRKQLMNTLKPRLTFRYIEPHLYVDFGVYQSDSVMIEYMPALTDVEEVPDGSIWLNYLRKLVLAKSKYMLGRIRGKYDVQNSPFSTDGKDLVQEGLNEEERLLEDIREDADVFFPE